MQVSLYSISLAFTLSCVSSSFNYLLLSFYRDMIRLRFKKRDFLMMAWLSIFGKSGLTLTPTQQPSSVSINWEASWVSLMRPLASTNPSVATVWCKISSSLSWTSRPTITFQSTNSWTSLTPSPSASWSSTTSKMQNPKVPTHPSLPLRSQEIPTNRHP